MPLWRNISTLRALNIYGCGLWLFISTLLCKFDLLVSPLERATFKQAALLNDHFLEARPILLQVCDYLAISVQQCAMKMLLNCEKATV